MSEKKNKHQETNEVIQGHAYDGIEELDNPLPRWWLYGFYLCIAFSFAYVGYYEFGPGKSLDTVYREQVSQIEAARQAKQAKGVDESVLIAALGDKGAIEKGKSLYAERCAACHGDAGQGLIGPNLTDKYWLHGGAPKQVLATIQKGVLDKGMPAWEDSMSEEEIMHTVAFIASIHDTHPEGAKEPQGVEYDPDGDGEDD